MRFVGGSMHQSCVCENGEACFHESFVFSVGETASGMVELTIYQPDGRLSFVSVSGFTSWKRTRDSGRIAKKDAVRHFNRTVIVDRIIRDEHCLTIDCNGIAFMFFGRNVVYTLREVATVEAPHVFGDAPGIEYRKKYMRYFTADRVSSSIPGNRKVGGITPPAPLEKGGENFPLRGNGDGTPLA